MNSSVIDLFESVYVPSPSSLLLPDILNHVNVPELENLYPSVILLSSILRMYDELSCALDVSAEKISKRETAALAFMADLGECG